jgi:hypothetical protein
MSRIKLPQLGIVVVVCALVGALAGIAGSAAAPSKSTSKKSSNALRFGPGGQHFRGRFGPGGPGGPGGPAVHAEAVVPNKAGTGFVTVTSDAGKVSSISGNDVTINESVGTLHYKDVTVTIPSGATVIRNHAKAAVSDLKTGDFIRVVSSSDGTFVMAEDAAFRAQEHKRFGGPGMWDHHGQQGPAGPPPAGAPGPGGGTY